MKISLLALFLFFTASAVAQVRQPEPFKQCNEIEVVTGKGKEEGYKLAGEFFASQGYEIQTVNREFFQIKTGGKEYKTATQKGVVGLNIRVADGSVFIKGRWWAKGEPESEAIPLKNQSILNEGFNQLNKAAHDYAASIGATEIYYSNR